MLHIQGTKIFQYCTCPAGPVTYNFHSSCKHMHLSFKRLCNKEHKGVICNKTSSSYSSQSTRPTGQVLWEELLVISRFTNARVEFLSPDISFSNNFFKKFLQEQFVSRSPVPDILSGLIWVHLSTDKTFLCIRVKARHCHSQSDSKQLTCSLVHSFSESFLYRGRS